MNKGSQKVLAHSVPPKDMTDAPKEGIRFYLKRFCRETSIHGFHTFVSPQKEIWSRMLYGIFLMLSFTSFTSLLVSLITEAGKMNTITMTELVAVSETEFPSVTLCNLSPFAVRNRDGEKMIYLEEQQLKQLGLLDNITSEELEYLSDVFNMTEEEYLSKYLFKLEEFIVDAHFNNMKINLTDFELAKFSGSTCYVFNGPDYVSKNGPRMSSTTGYDSGLNLILNIQQDLYSISHPFTAGIQVFITHYKESPRFMEGDGVILVAPGTSTLMSLSPVKFSFLPAPFRSYGNENCIESEEELLSKMRYGSVYNQNTCLIQCVHYNVSMDCQCYIKANGEIEGLKPCLLNGVEDKCYKSKLEELSQEMVNKRFKCDCPRRCSFFKYDITLSSSMYPSRAASNLTMKYLNESSEERIRENYLHLQFFMNSELVKEIKHKAQFSIEYFLSRLGGEMNLLLGASLVSLVEVFVTMFKVTIMALKQLWTGIRATVIHSFKLRR